MDKEIHINLNEDTLGKPLYDALRLYEEQTGSTDEETVLTCVKRVIGHFIPDPGYGQRAYCILDNPLDADGLPESPDPRPCVILGAYTDQDSGAKIYVVAVEGRELELISDIVRFS